MVDFKANKKHYRDTLVAVSVEISIGYDIDNYSFDGINQEQINELIDHLKKDLDIALQNIVKTKADLESYLPQTIIK